MHSIGRAVAELQALQDRTPDLNKEDSLDNNQLLVPAPHSRYCTLLTIGSADVTYDKVLGQIIVSSLIQLGSVPGVTSNLSAQYAEFIISLPPFIFFMVILILLAILHIFSDFFGMLHPIKMLSTMIMQPL